MTALIVASDRIPTLRQALGKFAMARLRRVGVGTVHPNWEERAAVCERCPMRVIRCGVSYCGKPFAQQIDRDPVMDGCGCPCREKAQSPSEHCPIDSHHQAAERGEICTCKWCQAALPKSSPRTIVSLQ
jgi:hypothetical protein